MGPWEQQVANLEAEGHLAEAAGRSQEAAAHFNSAGLAAVDGGLVTQAVAIFDRAAAALAAMGNQFDAAAVEANTALVASKVGQLDNARTRFIAALELLEDARVAGSASPDGSDLREADIRAPSRCAASPAWRPSRDCR